MLAPAQAWEVLHSAERVCSADAVTQSLGQVAAAITRTLAGDNPLLLCVMSGGMIFAGRLLPLLNFPLDFDYLHVTRYGDALHGGRVEWRVFPEGAVGGRTVLVIDDVLDKGHTMVEIRARTLAAGAARFYSAVFVDKEIGSPKPIAADFVGVRLPNRYLFGFGMDVRGAWRHLPEIYALDEVKVED